MLKGREVRIQTRCLLSRKRDSVQAGESGDLIVLGPPTVGWRPVLGLIQSLQVRLADWHRTALRQFKLVALRMVSEAFRLVVNCPRWRLRRNGSL